MELTQKQKEWLFKGEFIELFETFESKRKEYSSLTNKLNCTKIGYHIPQFDINSGNSSNTKVVEVSTYPIINDLLFKINNVCGEIEEIEKNIDKMRVKYKEIFNHDISYSELVFRIIPSDKQSK